VHIYNYGFSNKNGSEYDSNYELHISITLNTLIILDRQKCAEKILKDCWNNAFHNIHFSYDLQIPQALFVTVYKNTKDAESGKALFTFSYLQETRINGAYNIVDNPQTFTLDLNW